MKTVRMPLMLEIECTGPELEDPTRVCLLYVNKLNEYLQRNLISNVQIAANGPAEVKA